MVRCEPKLTGERPSYKNEKTPQFICLDKSVEFFARQCAKNSAPFDPTSSIPNSQSAPVADASFQRTDDASFGLENDWCIRIASQTNVDDFIRHHCGAPADKRDLCNHPSAPSASSILRQCSNSAVTRTGTPRRR